MLDMRHGRLLTRVHDILIRRPKSIYFRIIPCDMNNRKEKGNERKISMLTGVYQIVPHKKGIKMKSFRFF